MTREEFDEMSLEEVMDWIDNNCNYSPITHEEILIDFAKTKIDDDNTDCTMFYRIDKQTHSIQQISNVPITMKARQKNSTINIQLSDYAVFSNQSRIIKGRIPHALKVPFDRYP